MHDHWQVPVTANARSSSAGSWGSRQKTSIRAPEGLCMMIRARITFVLLNTSSCPSGSTSPMSAKCASEISPPR